MSKYYKSKSMRRFQGLKRLVVAVVLIGVCGELVARCSLGLGDPPLSMADPEIEYLFKPNQDVNRFGNRIKFNSYSMRSDDFPKEKTDDEIVRILVLGDSVINGGSRTDQSQLGTELLKKKLAEKLGTKVQVGNVSAGSWGPGNILAYLKKHGLFDADAIILVLSSHDAADKPTFEPLIGVSPAFPDKKPIFALEELIFRYLPRYLPGKKETSDQSQPTQAPIEAEDFIAIEDFKALIELIKESKTPVMLLQHPDRDELKDGYAPGHQAIAEVADQLSVPRKDLDTYFREAIELGTPVYRDNIHPNAAGQEALSRAMYDAVSELIDLDSASDRDK